MNNISTLTTKRPIWHTVVMLTVGFWLSASLLLDWVIMPSMYFSGMMSQAGFATTGYLIFWNFNRLELLAAAVVLTGVLVLQKEVSNTRWGMSSVTLSLILLAVAVAQTYIFMPQMSALGLHLNVFDTTLEVPTRMNLLHGAYWGLETLKLAVGGTLLGRCLW